METLHLPGFESSLDDTAVTCVEVAVPLPISGTFTYRVPEQMEKKVHRGVRVRIPFKNRELVGYLVSSETRIPEKNVKSILQILDEEPVLSEEILSLTCRVSHAYGSSWGEAIENALPKWVKYGKKAERALKKQIDLVEEFSSTTSESSHVLSPDQKKALKVIEEEANQNPQSRKPILLFGVTGSGKSEVYIRVIREILEKNQSAICLVPEIALTEQLRLFFREHFGGELEILHSKLNDTERFLAWKRIEGGVRRVILGPRSAVFAPVKDLGLIIMDEEHENSYKQDTVPRYHAREVAAWRCRDERAVFVMGSATPSLESMQRAHENHYRLVEMPIRIDDRPLPKVEVLDMKVLRDSNRKQALLSPRLSSEIQLNLDKKEGTLLLLNRRGFSTYIHCKECGTVESCPRCHVSLTFHHEDDSLICHYCNYSKIASNECSGCKMPVLRFAGFGTEKVESEVASLFPAAKIARMDTDSIRKKGSHETILNDFRDRKIDILIGTQMIAKGFDIHHVTLVGVVLADVGLMLPDFRSSERTFQLLTQVAGRAGRGEKRGRVYIQTFSPNHPSIECAKDHDYNSFFAHEIAEREKFRYPPYCRLYNLIIRGKEEDKTYQFARKLRAALDGAYPHFREEGNPDYDIMGPSPLPFYKLRGQFRMHVMIKTPFEGLDSLELIQCLGQVKRPSGMAFALDVDPLNIL